MSDLTIAQIVVIIAGIVLHIMAASLALDVIRDWNRSRPNTRRKYGTKKIVHDFKCDNNLDQ